MAIVAGNSTLTTVPKIIEGAKLSFVLALREMFKSTIADENLRYNDDPNLTKIRIYTAHPLTLEFFPSLVVSGAGGDASMTYLQEDFVKDDDDAATVTYAGRVALTISITVLTQSTLERERIMDHLIIFTRHLFRTVLHGYNIEFTKDMRIGPENILEVENRLVYEQTFDIPCYMEYNAVVDQSTLDSIRAIGISSGNISLEVMTA